MTKRKAASNVGNLLRDRLQSVAEQAVQAQGMSPQDDNLLDLVDDIDRDLQAAIEIINRLRRQEA